MFGGRKCTCRRGGKQGGRKCTCRRGGKQGGRKTHRVKSRRGGMVITRNVNGQQVRDLTQPRQDMK